MIKRIIFCLLLGAIFSYIFTIAMPKLAFGDEVPRNAIYAPKKAIVEPAWTDDQIVTAIYYAEGGKHAEYPYGIRSVKCATAYECRSVCLTTVQHNRKRFARADRLKYPAYLVFLASRYCPVGAGKDAAGLNKNWLRNVNWYLNHPKT